MKRLALIALSAFATLTAFAGTPDFTNSGSGPQPDHWAGTPVWRLNTSRGSNITGSRSLADVAQASFNSWTSAPNTALSAQRGADTTITTSGMDGQNVVCFTCSGDFASESETLGVTMTTTATDIGSDDGHGGKTQFVGQILDADIFFNPNHKFSTDGASGDVQDLQTVLTHEVGHFFGLDHSAVVRAIMFPFAPDSVRLLSFDDVAAISSVYPKRSPDVPVGSISGTVRLNGAGVFGAHVYAESQSNANAFSAFPVRKTPIGALSKPDGSYQITGVQADSYIVVAEPLDLPVVNKDVADFGNAYGRTVQTNFTTRWH